MKIIYFGFNDPLKYARGVENVIKCQSYAVEMAYYLYFDSTKKNTPKRWGNLICIPLKKTCFWPLTLNLILLKLFFRNNKSIFIHSHNYLMSLFAFFQSNLFTVHDALSYQYRALGRDSRIWALIERTVYRKCNNLHFVSDFSRKQALLLNASKPIHIVYNSSIRELYKSQKDYHISPTSFVTHTVTRW